MKVRITAYKGRAIERKPVVGEFDSLAAAIAFTGSYMRITPGPHRGITAMKFVAIAERRKAKR